MDLNLTKPNIVRVLRTTRKKGVRAAHLIKCLSFETFGPGRRIWRKDLIPADILWELKKLRYHPFIILVDSHLNVKVCPDQNDVHVFAAELAGSSDHSAFVRGLLHALKGECYESAFAFFDWVNNQNDLAESYIFAPTERPFPNYCEYPIFTIGQTGPDTPAKKSELLANIFTAYENCKRNDAVRMALLEALAFALSKALGALAEYKLAIEFVQRGLIARPDSFYLPMCLHTLEQKARDLPTPKRLEKFAGKDEKALDQFTCTLPFTRMEIAPAGDIHVCCPVLVPTPIGNIENASTSQAMNSEQARKIRASVLDGSFRYCNPMRCQKMIRNALPSKTDPELLKDPILGRAIIENDPSINEVRELAFGYDASCNLSCPSCRREVIIDTHKQSKHRSQQITTNIAPLLPKLRLLYINHSGEFLFSRPSRELLQSIDRFSCPELTIDLISNGTLFSEAEWQKFSNIHGLVRQIRISTDAAGKEAFEVVRRGGKWNRFVGNLKFIGELRRRREIETFMLAFTYQIANFREMPAFVELAKEVGADEVSFEPIVPTGAMSDSEYTARAVHLFAHPGRAEFLEVLKHPNLSDSRVHADWRDTASVPSTIPSLAGG